MLSENKLLVVTEQDKKLVRDTVDHACQGLTTLTEAFVAIEAHQLSVQWFDCSKKEITILKYEETTETFIRGETLKFDYRPQAAKYEAVNIRCAQLLARVLNYNKSIYLNKDQFHSEGEMKANIIKEFEDLPIPDYCWSISSLYWCQQKSAIARSYHGLPKDELDAMKLESVRIRVKGTYLDATGDILKKLNLL